MRVMKLLVVAERPVLAGGLLRFEHVRRALDRGQDELCFAFLKDKDTASDIFPSSARMFDFESAGEEFWDAVMVPGAGFSETTLMALGRFREPRFGLRIQHILNDRRVEDRFKIVNQTFRPDIVVYNNTAWTGYGEQVFAAQRHVTLIGAVDCDRFRPSHDTRSSGVCTIGGLANKNVGPLLQALDLLPAEFRLVLFGKLPQRIAERSEDPRKESGRLHYTGPLFGDALNDYYRSCDMVVMTEKGAGWANLAAEALACGRPLVTTPHGTDAFARHGETAVICPDPTPQALATAIETLWRDPQLRRALSVAGRSAIEPYSWQEYTRQLIKIITEYKTERVGEFQ